VKTVTVRAPSDCNYTVNKNFVSVSCGSYTFTGQNYPMYPSFANISDAINVNYTCLNCVSGNIITTGSAALVQVRKF
jgi:hypothetical protein